MQTMYGKTGSLGLAPPTNTTITMSRVESIIGVLLLQLVAELHVQAADYQCNEVTLSNCINNPVLIVIKSIEHYRVTLQTTKWQCYNEFCLLADHQYQQRSLTCNDICGACRKLQPPGKNGKKKRVYP